MKIKYIGTCELSIDNYGVIREGDIIERTDLAESLKHREDFETIEEVTEEIIEEKPRGRKKKEK